MMPIEYLLYVCCYSNVQLTNDVDQTHEMYDSGKDRVVGSALYIYD